MPDRASPAAKRNAANDDSYEACLAEEFEVSVPTHGANVGLNLKVGYAECVRD